MLNKYNSYQAKQSFERMRYLSLNLMILNDNVPRATEKT